MSKLTRPLLVASCLALVMALGCGGNPAAPSPASTGAVLAGVVIGADSRVPAGLTVAVMGTSLSTAIGSAGEFQITGVPPGDVQVQFRNQDINATARLAGVASNQFVQIRVEVSSTSAVIVNEERTEKVSLCHSEGNGTYHLIDVSVSAEATHRAHGDGKIGDPVPGQPLKTFDANCRPVGPSVEIQKSTNGEDADLPPGPSIALGSVVTWRYVVTNTGTVPLTNVHVVDDHPSVTVACGQTSLAAGASMTCTATGVATQLGQYRNLGTVTANWSTPTASGTLTETDPSHYTGISPVEIKKFTNGEDADSAPGPSITIGTPVTWEYRVTNVGTVMLTGILVVDDHPIAVNCQGQTTLAPGASMTCTASGVAVAGQYSNVGTVTASWSQPPVSGTATDSDPSHYFGRLPDEDGQKVNLCHRTGAGFFVLINVSINAEPAHLAHGDGRPGGAVPGSPGRVFSASCGVQ